MTSKRLFPQFSHDYVRQLVGESPFLDLPWHFNMDLENIGERLRNIEPTVFGNMDFDEFKARHMAELDDSAKKIIKVFHSDEENPESAEMLRVFSELSLYSQYIVEMDRSKFTADVLLDYYARVDVYVRICSMTQPGPFSDLTTCVILEPTLKWAGRKGVNKIAGKLLDQLKSTIDETWEILRARGFDADQLEYQNNLIFCYFILAQALKMSIIPDVVSRHLLIFRHASSSQWASVPSRIRMQYATLILHLVTQFYPPNSPFKSMLGFSYNTLADLRAVLADGASSTSIEAPFTVSQWVFRWFTDKIDAEVFSMRRHAGHAASLALLSEGEQRSAVELSKRFASYRLPVTLHHLERFLLQFGSTMRIRGALRLLTHCKFFPLWELGESMERLLASDLDDDPASRLVIAPLGDQSGSTAIMKYLASHSSLVSRLHFADDIRSALAHTKDGDCLHFVDDCLLSGTQTLNILGDLMGTRDRKSHHTVHCEVLSIEDRVELRKRSLTFLYCVVTDKGLSRFDECLAATGIDPMRTTIKFGVLEHSSAKAFEPMGSVPWASVDEREEVKQFATEVGYDILGARAKRKNWEDSRRQESALGYSDFQRLLIFPYNVPKTSVTLLWERGTESRNWQPLFPGFD